MVCRSSIFCGQSWFSPSSVVVCDGLWWAVVVCGGLSGLLRWSVIRIRWGLILVSSHIIDSARTARLRCTHPYRTTSSTNTYNIQFYHFPSSFYCHCHLYLHISVVVVNNGRVIYVHYQEY